MKCIISADYHLRDSRPRCRVDEDWIETQVKILRFIADMSNKYDAPICIVADIFHKANVHDRIKSLFFNFCLGVEHGVYIEAGNHDLPWHSWENVDDSSFGVIWNSKIVRHLNELGKAAHWGEPLSGPDNDIMFIHRLTFPDKKSIPPNVNAITAQELLDEFPNAKWIFTGDNHHAFHYVNKHRHVINSGCISRQAADFKDYKPRIFYVDTEAEIVEPLFIPDTEFVVIDDYLRSTEERTNRISAFIETIKSKKSISFDFVENVKKAKAEQKFSEGTLDMIDELMTIQEEAK